MRIRLYDDATGKMTDVDKSPDWLEHGTLEAFRFQWSPDSRWIAYARPSSTSNKAIFLFDTTAGKLQQATSGYLNDTQPTFDPEGKYLFYASDRAFDPVYGTFDNSGPTPTRRRSSPSLCAKDVKSPLAARNDAENARARHRQEERAQEADDKPPDPPPVAVQHRHRFRSVRGPCDRAAAEGRQRTPTCGRSTARCSIVVSLAPARATRRARSSISTSRSVRRRPSWTMPTASK